MSHKVLSIFVLLFMVSSLALAGATAPEKAPIQNLKQIGPRDFPVPDGSILQYNPPNYDEIVGENFVFGTTWYDIQHNGTCGHQLNIDANGYAHLAWMNGLDNGASQRHIYYQIGDTEGVPQFTVPTVGVQVDQLPRAGYTTECLGDDGRAFIVYHQGQGGTSTFHTAVSHDFLPGIGAFSTTELPWVYDPLDLEVIWPKCAIDNSERIHIVSTENPASGVAGDPQRHYYGWAEYNPSTFSMDVCEEQEMITWAMVIAADVAASEVSDRVAIGYMQMNATEPDTNQYDNDVILIISEDGQTWDWTDTINVTNFIPPDDHLLPDTLAADKDTLRAYTDMCLVFDNFDVLHVFFTVSGYYAFEGTITIGQSFIYHWDEYYQHFSMVASGFFDPPYTDPGAWNRYVNRASAAVDPETNDIYCIYQRYRNPIGPGSQFPYFMGDTLDLSSTNWPNADIWATKSTDGGWSWAEGINVTRTYTPGAAPNDCMSELTPSAAPQIYDDMFHFFYILDKDAGAVVQDEGTWTLNDAIYHRILLEEIPESPRQFSYPMHIDSAGWPSDTIPPYYNADPGKGITPVDFALSQNYPNPFNPETTIRYTLAENGLASLKVFNINGEEVATLVNGVQTAGTHEAIFNAQEMASGLYFYTLEVNGLKYTKKMVLLK